MNYLLTKNPTLTYLHAFLLSLPKHGYHNKLANSPTPMIVISQVVTKWLQSLLKIFEDLACMQTLKVLVRSTKLVGTCNKTLDGAGLNLGAARCKLLARAQC